MFAQSFVAKKLKWNVCAKRLRRCAPSASLRRKYFLLAPVQLQSVKPRRALIFHDLRKARPPVRTNSGTPSRPTTIEKRFLQLGDGNRHACRKCRQWRAVRDG